MRTLPRRRPRSRAPAGSPPPALSEGTYDLWLEHLHGERLARIDAACAGGGPECYALFRDLDPDLWALLLTQELALRRGKVPEVRAFLAEAWAVPEAHGDPWLAALEAELAAPVGCP